MRYAWPHVESHRFVAAWHIDAICEHLQAVSEGAIRKLIINVPPRTSKSTTVSVLWQPWEWTWQPASQFLFASYSGDLAIRDAVKSRYLTASEWYQSRWSYVWYVPAGENLKTRYTNNHRGYRISTSVGGVTTGEGGDRLIVDDPIDMSNVYSDAQRQSVLDWWDIAMVNRLNNPKTGARVLVGQRSHDADLFGHILERDHDYVHLMLPMEFDPARRCRTLIFVDPRTEPGELLNPERFGPKEVADEQRTKTERDYQAQYQQRPTGQSGLIIKRHWWRRWPHHEPPECLFVLQFFDTAFEAKEEADCSARTTWGVFRRCERYDAAQGTYVPSDDPADAGFHCILLERWAARVGFPELRAAAKAGVEAYDPDWVFVERRASGHSLVQELRRVTTCHGRKVPVRSVKKNVDKVAAMHYASIVPEKGHVWYMDRAWAQDVIEQVSKFPMAEHDDLADSAAMAWAWLRRRNEIGFDDEADETDDVELFKPRAVYG